MEILFRENADVSLLDTNGNTVLDLALDQVLDFLIDDILSIPTVTETMIIQALNKINPIISAGALVTAQKYISFLPEGYTILDAVAESNLDTATAGVRAFLNLDVDINQVDENSQSTLMIAILENRMSIVNDILSTQTANLNLQDDKGLTPLAYAAVMCKVRK